MNDQEPDFFRINENKLHQEWMRQPELYYEYAMALAKARREAEQKKADLKLVQAELDRDIRADPQSFGIEKVTEKVVENSIILDKRYRKALAELIEADHDTDVAGVAVTTLDHRKKALEMSVQLRIANLYSPPKVPKGATREDADNIMRQEKRVTK